MVKDVWNTHLYTLDKSSLKFLRSLYTFIRLDENGEYSHPLRKPESTQLVNFLDEAPDVIPVSDALFRRCHRQLRLICSHHNVLPSSYIIHEGLKKANGNAVAGGGFADVWEGTYKGGPVCLKVPRIKNGNADTNNENSSLALFYGEAVVWKRLKHPNIVRFLGVTTTPLQIVSEWMPNGTLLEYMKANPSDIDRTGLLLDVAEGVNYLHTFHMFHGDLKGPNILIDSNKHTRISDFGLTSIAYGLYSSSMRSDKGRSMRWSAPEVLFGTVSASAQADMFAFGMVEVEVFTGDVPLHDIISTLVSFKIMNGERPPRPHEAEALGLSDALWMMTESCWQQDPKDRLGSSEVVDLLREMYVTSPNNPLVDGVDGNRKLARSSSVAPQTDAALSPKLLDILQYHTVNDTTQLNNDTDTSVGRFSGGGPANTVGHQTSSQYPTYGIEQRSGGASQGQNDPRFPQPFRSETFDTVWSDVWETAPNDVWPMMSTIPPQPNLNRVPETITEARDTQESPIAIPKISIHSLNSTPNHRIVDTSDYQSFTPTEDVRTERGALSSGLEDNAGDNRARKLNGATKTGPQGPRPSGQRIDVPHKDLPVLPVAKPQRDPATLNLEPIQRTPSRSSSMRKAIRTAMGGLLGALGLGNGSSKPSTRATTPTADRGENPKGEGDIPPQKTGGAKKGPSKWGRVRGVAKVIGLQKRTGS